MYIFSGFFSSINLFLTEITSTCYSLGHLFKPFMVIKLKQFMVTDTLECGWLLYSQCLIMNLLFDFTLSKNILSKPQMRFSSIIVS